MNNVVDALIEIPYGSRNKYEVDKTTGRIRLDRVLYSAMAYPGEYGYIENTLAPDGDPLDILLISSEPTVPGCIVPARVLGYLATVDRGMEDYKLIAVVDCDPRYSHIQKLEDLSPFLLEEISNFFQNYKVLQNMQVDVGEYYSLDATMRIVDECRRRYLEATNAGTI
jgi:inorganic pyrophosphatase